MKEDNVLHLHLAETRGRADAVRLVAGQWDGFRVGPTVVAAAPSHFRLQISHPSFASAAAAVQRARGRTRTTVSWEDWVVYIRILSPPGKLDRSKLADLKCRYFIDGGTTYSTASPKLAALVVESLQDEDGTGEWVTLGSMRPLVPTPPGVTDLVAWSLGPARRTIEAECNRRISAGEHHMSRGGGLGHKEAGHGRRPGERVDEASSSSAHYDIPGGGERPPIIPYDSSESQAEARPRALPLRCTWDPARGLLAYPRAAAARALPRAAASALVPHRLWHRHVSPPRHRPLRQTGTATPPRLHTAPGRRRTSRGISCFAPHVHGANSSTWLRFRRTTPAYARAGRSSAPTPFPLPPPTHA